MIKGLGAACAAFAVLTSSCERKRLVLSCEKFGTPIDVRDFGGCGGPTPEDEAKRYAEQLAASCGVPVRYCSGASKASPPSGGPK